MATMKTIRSNPLSPLLLWMLLALPAAPLWAVPTFVQAPAAKADQRAEAQRQRCELTQRVEMETRDGSRMQVGRARLPQLHAGWLEAQGEPWSPHARTVLQGEGSNGLDTMLGNCRLADGEVDKEARINDGVEVADLLKQIDEWLDLNRHADDEEPHQPDSTPTLQLSISDSDHQLHAYLGLGPDGHDLGLVSGDEQFLLLDDQPGSAGPAHPPRYGGAPAAPQGASAGLTSAVPEPAGYALLLGGLGLLALLRRRA